MFEISDNIKFMKTRFTIMFFPIIIYTSLLNIESLLGPQYWFGVMVFSQRTFDVNISISGALVLKREKIMTWSIFTVSFFFISLKRV